MVPTSQREINQREKDLYYTVLSFLKKIRKAGKTTAKEWDEYRSAIKSVAMTADMGKAADLWTMDNLDQFSPDKSQLPPLNTWHAYRPSSFRSSWKPCITAC